MQLTATAARYAVNEGCEDESSAVCAVLMGML